MLVHPAEARRQFREFAAGEITNENLAYGALLVTLEDYPRIDIAHYIAELDALAVRARARCLPGEPPIFRLGHLHAELFDGAGYCGDEINYYDNGRGFYFNSPDGHGFEPKFLMFIGNGFRSGMLPCNRTEIYWFFTWTPSEHG